MKHTEEPWFVEEVTKPNGDVAIGIASEQFDIVCVTLRKVIRKMEDAERIVACVNACAGVENDCLEQGYVNWLQQRIVELELSVMNLEEEIAKMKAMNNHLVTNGEWEDV